MEARRRERDICFKGEREGGIINKTKAEMWKTGAWKGLGREGTRERGGVTQRKRV